ncbi:MAG TPA: hypothetical protein PLD55_05810 [bacterium]|nr:hypothetical protein [bacterium]HNZ53921.1 hypothetical protein [bacterium]HOB70546.1 hypothetical protein [bacterium]HOG42842.1 hypothetical protein [bacterium]HPA56894.1 hypothetical protein [bacterium]
MRLLSAIITCCMVFALSCGSADSKDDKTSMLEKKIEMIKADNKEKLVTTMVKVFELKSENEKFINETIMDMQKEILKKVTPHGLDKFKESPNRDLKIPSNVSQIHLKNNYPSGNAVVFLMKDGDPSIIDVFEFNTEKKYEVEPGNYSFIMTIDRKFNNNIFVFKSDLNFRGGELYLGEFNINSQYNKSGSCEQGFIPDDDMCIIPSFKILDNCNPGSHLVEHLCCEEGFNFIMEGKCSRYSDAVESVICPAGYHEGGKGRCCPKGMLFIDDQCQVPPKDAPAPAPEQNQ